MTYVPLWMLVQAAREVSGRNMAPGSTTRSRSLGPVFGALVSNPQVVGRVVNREKKRSREEISVTDKDGRPDAKTMAILKALEKPPYPPLRDVGRRFGVSGEWCSVITKRYSYMTGTERVSLRSMWLREQQLMSSAEGISDVVEEAARHGVTLFPVSSTRLRTSAGVLVTLADTRATTRERDYRILRIPGTETVSIAHPRPGVWIIAPASSRPAWLRLNMKGTIHVGVVRRAWIGGWSLLRDPGLELTAEEQTREEWCSW
jgi:hypothetical protein